MRFLLIIGAIYLLLYVFKKIGMPSIQAGILSGFSAALIVNIVLFTVSEFKQFAVVEGILSVGFALVWGFFASNKFYGVKNQD